MSTAPKPELVFDGNLIRARLWQPDQPSTALYVTFRPWEPGPGSFSDRGLVQRALDRGLAHLHLQSRWNDWFLNAETTALEHALARLRNRYRTARAFGYSMGGYAALRFSKSLRLNHALIVSPQYSLHPSLVPEEDRYPEAAGFDPDLGDLASHCRPDLSGVIVFDPFCNLDLIHARRIAALLPAVSFARLGFGGHPGTAALGQAGGFRRLQRISFAAEPKARDIVGIHRDLRRNSLRYWRERAECCLRKGRLAAAAEAIDRAEALAGLPPEDHME